MTREEAIKILKELPNSILGVVLPFDIDFDYTQALDMAIKSLEQEPYEDAVSRKDVHDMLENLPVTVEDKWFNWLQKACMRLAELPSVTSQEQQTFKWCTDCKEYDQKKHCCHRWSKVIRNTVEKMKQEYIERDVLDKIKAEIKDWQTDIHDNEYDANKYDFVFERIFEIIDEYKAESEK